MEFLNAFGVDFSERELICFVGAGGKTTSMFRLARELKDRRKRTLVTTTTALFYPGDTDCDRVILIDAVGPASVSDSARPGCIICCGSSRSQDNKLLGVDAARVDLFFHESRFDCILVEADGSRRLPVKAPAGHEPVLPAAATRVVGVIGLDCLGTTVDADHVHRPELFCRVTGAQPGSIIGTRQLVSLILSPEGLFKSVPGSSRRYLLLNKADDEAALRQAAGIIRMLRQAGAALQGCICASMLQDTRYVLES